MRKYVLMWVVLLCCGGYVSGETTEGPLSSKMDAEFQASASVLEAIEGGPLVIKAVLKYCGTHPLQVTNSSIYPSPFFDGIPHEWGMGIVISGAGSLVSRSGMPSCRQIKPGEEWTKIHYLHHRYHNISTGRVKLKLSWTVRRATHPWKIMARLEIPLVINIHPADTKHLSALRERLQNRLDTARHSADAETIEDVLNYMKGTKHSALVSLAWRIVQLNPAYHRMAGIWFITQYSKDLHEADLRLARSLSELDLSERRDLLRCWARRETRISPDALYVLKNSACLWDRLLTYLYISKLCEKRWVNKLLSDLSTLTQPVPPARFISLLRNLDDDRFTVREASTTQLTAHGDRVETQLTDSLKKPLSPEAKRRVRLILDRIAAAKEAPEWKPIVEHLSLGDCDRDAAIAVLRALAKGNPDAALTKAAVASLNKLTAHK